MVKEGLKFAGQYHQNGIKTGPTFGGFSHSLGQKLH